MSNLELETALEEIEFAFLGGASVDTVAANMKKLAQAQYPPALDFFIRCLQGKRPEWRTQALIILGSHYDLLGNEKGLEALRGVLRGESDPQLRRKAVEFLSLYASWPEQGLIDALESDPDMNVRYAALQAILELLGIPRMRVRDEIGMLRASRVQPTMGDVRRITQSGRASPARFF